MQELRFGGECLVLTELAAVLVPDVLDRLSACVPAAAGLRLERILLDLAHLVA